MPAELPSTEQIFTETSRLMPLTPGEALKLTANLCFHERSSQTLHAPLAKELTD